MKLIKETFAPWRQMLVATAVFALLLSVLPLSAHATPEGHEAELQQASVEMMGDDAPGELVSFCHVDDRDGPDGPFVYMELEPWQMAAQGHLNPGVYDIIPPIPFWLPDGTNWDGDASQTFIDNRCAEPEITIIAQKIVCTDEADLPNWGTGAPKIEASTASNWVAEHESCELVRDWEFEWAPYGTADPGDTLVGPVGGAWTTFTGSTVIPESVFDDEGAFWVREVLQEGYIPFSYGPEGDQNTNDYTAEIYCHTDGLNYDNFDRIDEDQEANDEYYCVAWNVPVEVPGPEYGPYCGDGIVNQEWEQCDPGHLAGEQLLKRTTETVGCSVQCQYVTEPVCTDLTLAKIDMSVENSGDGDMSTDIYLGQSALPIPNTAWFMVYWNGTYADDPDIVGYEDVPGLAVERGDGTIRSVMYGSSSAKDEEHVNGTIEMWSWDDSVVVTSVASDDSGNNKLEGDYTDGSGIGDTNAGDDEISVSGDDANFWLTTTTEDDGFYTYYSDPAECPVCEADVELLENGGFEAPLVAPSTYSIFYTGEPLLAWLTGDYGIEIQNNVAGTPYAGDQHAELDPDHPTMIWQEVETIPGETYRFSAYYSPRPNRDAADNEFEFMVDGSPLGASISREGTSTTDWSYEEREFVATGLTTEVGFREIGTDTSYGAYLDNVSLMCVPEHEPPVDVCENLEGYQSEVPEGYEDIGDGICEPIEIDVCSNIEGIQGSVPEGYVLEEGDMCVPEEDDGPTSYSSGTKTNRNIREGQVLGASTSFCPFLTDYMQMGWQNDPNEVSKLQIFLNTFRSMYGGIENPVTGFFGQITDANVKAFQEHYRNDVLGPWYLRGIVPHENPTGFVYKTTLWKINSIICPDYAETPSFVGENLSTNIYLHAAPVSD